MRQSNKGNAQLTIVIIVGILAVIFIVAFVSEFFKTVQPSYQAIVVKGGELQEEVLTDGFYMKTPFWTDIVPVFVGQNSTDDSRNVKSFRGIEPLSKDGQKMVIDAQIEYAVTNPIMFRETTGSVDESVIETLVIIPQIRRLIYDYTAEYTWKSLIQGGERQELGQRIFKTLTTGDVSKRICTNESTVKDKNTGIETISLAGCKIIENGTIEPASKKGVAITSVNLRKVEPNQSIIDAVEKAQLAEQQVLVAKQNAEIETQKANQVIEKKRGETESKKLEAEASAYKLRIEKEEEAKGLEALAAANKLFNASLQGGEDLIEFKRLDVEMVVAEAQLQYAKGYKGAVPNTISVIGTEEAQGMSIIMGNGVVPTAPLK